MHQGGIVSFLGKGTGPRTYENPLDGLRYAVIDDRDRETKLLVLYPIPFPDDPWGVLAPLKGTSWGKQIPTVTGEALSHALHGRAKPLREMLGVPPHGRLLKIDEGDRRCLEQQQQLCPMAGPDCIPGSTRLPDCYVAPSEDRTLRVLGEAVGRAWDEGRYVFVVEGPEFVVT